jgi:transmembrane sensor
MAACLLFFPPASLLVRFQSDYSTSVAELRRLILEDGTVVHLGPRSALDVHYTPARRSLRLLAGEAMFEVTANRARPFVVGAAELEITVTGTVFDVRLAPASTTVDIQSGSVAVRYDRGTPAAELRLSPGDRLVVDPAAGTVLHDRISPEDVAPWRDGRLFVKAATIAQVVEELRRYQPGWILIADDRLAAQQVTGLYDLHDPVRALRALVQPSGGRVQQVTPFLHILLGP